MAQFLETFNILHFIKPTKTKQRVIKYAKKDRGLDKNDKTKKASMLEKMPDVINTRRQIWFWRTLCPG